MQIQIAVLVVFFSFAHAVVAAPNCDQWNTAEYFKTATVGDARACLDAGADPTAREVYSKHTPLHMAAMASRSSAVIKALLAAGAEVNARVGDGDTPLQAAFNINARREPAVIEALLAAGADPNVRGSNDWTPLHNAAYDAEDAEPIKLLLAAGAVVDARDRRTYHSAGGRTSLHLAVSSDAVPAAIEALLAAGADVNARLQSLKYKPLIIIDLLLISSLQFPHYFPLFEKEPTGRSRMLTDRSAEYQP